MSAAYISLGSNIAPEDNLRAAALQLREAFGELRVSPVYRSASVGFDGPDFLNAIAEIDTQLPATEIVNILLHIELQCLRDRTQPRFSSRTLDLDLLMLEQQIIETAELTLPHPDILQQVFVLQPLADIAGSTRHPQAGCTIAEIWNQFQYDVSGPLPVMSKVELLL